MIIGCLTKAPCAQLSTAEQILPGETLLDFARCAKASLMIVYKLDGCNARHRYHELAQSKLRVPAAPHGVKLECPPG